MASSAQGKSIAEKPTLPVRGQAGRASDTTPVEPMFIPRVGQRVSVAGQKEQYIVMRVDRERYLADVMCITGTKRVEKGVLLLALSTTPLEKAKRLPRPTILRKES